MPTSLWDKEVQEALNQVRLDNTKLTASPEDWRDKWIYFALVDRFNNPKAPPKHLPYDDKCGSFQGGTIEGVRQQIKYLKDLGVGAIWISPVLCNCQFLNGQPNEGTYHGYGIQNFLRIDPRLVTDKTDPDGELIKFVNEAHEQGIYIILDIVLNHAGDVFGYEPNGDSDKYFRGANPYTIYWRDQEGKIQKDWTEREQIDSSELNATVFPKELRKNSCFRREGKNPDLANSIYGDFESLKQLRTEDPVVGNILMRIHQYLIAKYDIDGFRIDTLKYIDPKFSTNFGNAIREFGLSAGKKNFFTFGEVYDRDSKIAQFIGRNTKSLDDAVGVDAALDFPLFFTLPNFAKGIQSPKAIVDMYMERKKTLQDILSSHGEASRYFVTFLDNHDQHNRFYYSDASDPHKFDDQATLGFGCLFSLPGIPCIYYGTEQGLHGSGDSDQNVREALWGKFNAFDPSHPFYKTIQALSEVRKKTPALRYGRFYFRPISGDGQNFGISTYRPGVLAFSRVLNDQEVVVVANACLGPDPQDLKVIVDSNINPEGSIFQILFSNKSHESVPPQTLKAQTLNNVTVTEVNGSSSHGPITIVPVTLQPSEIQILARPLGE
jgi:glycosidase